MSKQPVRKEVETTGHEWDGIQEYNNPLPRWWLWTFYGTIIWALIYTILYPAWPIFSTGATPGVLGYSSRAEVQAEIDRFKAMRAPLDAKLVKADLTTVKEQDPELYRYALHGGAAVFRTWCAQCHGAGGQGGPGYPNLLDDDWLWGGTVEDIYYTVSHGIRSPDDEDTRTSEMPSFADVLEPAEVEAVANYVLKLAGEPHDEAKATAGETVFADNCAGCHGEQGEGSRDVGAPRLNDAIWLKVREPSVEAIKSQVLNPKHGVMPAWSVRLDDAAIRQVTLYVHSLGGGE
ncbi:MAG: cytochrome-c oxidase, cbb3-type subunit III [Alphaproteobacteria bacterium]|nr:MAG: cytochrome-c oxidase, cbb3-type subunit III [Alphaproteobacteria bacterium]